MAELKTESNNNDNDGDNNNDKNNNKNKNNVNKGEPPVSFIVRTNLGWQMCEYNYNKNKLILNKTKISKCHDSDITFSSDGEYFGVIIIDGIEIYNSYTYRLIGILKHKKVRYMYFSPLNNYIVSFNNRNENDKNGNCYIWRWNQLNIKDNIELKKLKISNDKPIYKYFLNEYDKYRKPVSFSNNEIICARTTKNAILIHDCNTLHYHNNSILAKLDIPNINYVSIAPIKRVYNKNSTYHSKNIKPNNNKNNYNNNKIPEFYTIATFALPKKGKAALITLWSYTYSKSKKIRTPFFKDVQRAFMGVDECTFLWNLRGDTLLAIVSSEVDIHLDRYVYIYILVLYISTVVSTELARSSVSD